MNENKDNLKQKTGMMLKLEQKQKQKLLLDNSNSELDINKLIENPYQPRLEMDEEKLLELATSIEEQGLIQPIPIARYNAGKANEENILIAGHRRLAACKLNGYEKVKVNIRDDISKQQLAAMALIENIQREDLDVVEVAMQYAKLLEEGIFTSNRELAKAIGINESTVSRTLNVNKLPQFIINDVKSNRTTKDVIVLNAISKIKNDEQAIEIYNWFITTNVSREELTNKIKSLNTVKDKITELYTIKRGKKDTTIKLPILNDEQYKKVEDFIKNIINE